MKFHNHNDQQIKTDIKHISLDVLVNHGIAQHSPDSKIVCPFCGNGSHDNGTGVSVTQDALGNWRGYCFACGKSFDNLSLIAAHFGYDLKADFPKVLAEGATLLGASADFGDFTAAKNFNSNSQVVKDKKPPVDHSKFLESAFLNLEDLPESERRGLDLATLIHFNCGFVSDWNHPDSPKMPKTSRLIVPTSKFHYLARAVDDSVPKEFRKIHVGHKEIFNLNALKENSTIIVVEGEIDVMSVWQVTNGLVPVVAVSGCANFKTLLDWLGDNPDCNCSFIVMFDNDSNSNNSGQTNAKKFVAELKRRGFPAINTLLSDKQDFDANDWLQKNPDALRDRIFELFDESFAELQIVAEEIEKEQEFQAKVVDFENLNGIISPAVLDDIKTAAQFLLSLQADTFDANLLHDATFIHQLGLCSFYSFVGNSLNNFWEVFNSKRKLAIFKNKNNLPLDDSDKIIRNFSETDIRKLIKKSSKFVESKHNEFNKECEKQERQRLRDAQRRFYEACRDDNFERLKQLKQMLPSEERNNEMRVLIADLCDWQKDRQGNKLFIKPIVRNFKLIFSYDPLIDGLFGYDAFSNSIVFLKEPFWRKVNVDVSCIGNTFQDIDYDNLANYVSDTYGDIPCRTNFNRQISSFAVEHTFHPIKSYFENLPQWDGVPRAEKIFIDYLGVDDSPYSREVTLNFFIAALARVYHPGCEYQYMPVLQGDQGIGKGKIIKMLVDSVIKSGYVELNTKLHDSHAVDILRLAWFVELPEMAATKGVSNSVIKSFISARSDTNRFAYAKNTTTFLRHNVFFSTINEKFPLKDKTGNRRFLVLRSNLKENQYIEGLTDDYIIQFWAEVFAKYQELFKDGFNENKLLLSKESILTAVEIAAECTEDDGLVGEILAFLEQAIPYEPVWRLLSREEHKRFFMDGGKITLTARDLLIRQAARRRPAEMQELKQILALAENQDTFIIQNLDDTLTFAGAVRRDSICATELLNECFTNSKHNIKVIAEILATELPKQGWLKSRRKNTIYGDQPNTYVREVIDCESEQTSLSENSKPVTDNEIIKQVASDNVTTDNEVAAEDSVTGLASSNFYVDDEEFLEDNEIADDDFGQFHDLQ